MKDTNLEDILYPRNYEKYNNVLVKKQSNHYPVEHKIPIKYYIETLGISAITTYSLYNIIESILR